MASNINPNNINGNFPVAGQDNDSQGFRDNFTNILNNFSYASTEITNLQNTVTNMSATLSTNGNVTAYYANVQQGLEVGSTSSFNDDVTFAGNLTFDYSGSGNPSVLYPVDDNSYDIGTSTHTFRNAYINNVVATSAEFDNSSTSSSYALTSIVEDAPTVTQNIDLKTNSNWYFTAEATTNFTANLRGNSTTTLASYLPVGGQMTSRVIITNGSSVAYYPTTWKIDGVTITDVKWVGAHTAATNSVEHYLLIITRLGVSNYSILASKSSYV